MSEMYEKDVVEVLTAHPRMDIGSCLCGWSAGSLFTSHPVHVAEMLASAGLIPEGEVETTIEWGVQADSGNVVFSKVWARSDAEAVAASWKSLDPLRSATVVNRTATTHHTPWQPVDNSGSEACDG